MLEKNSMSERKIIENSIEKFGVISISYIMRKLKLNYKGALIIMDKYKHLLPVFAIFFGLIFLTSCGFKLESGITTQNAAPQGAAAHANGGDGYRESFFSALYASGEGYKDSHDRAKNADEHLPAGEHPLDDERLDEWDGTLDRR